MTRGRGELYRPRAFKERPYYDVTIKTLCSYGFSAMYKKLEIFVGRVATVCEAHSTAAEKQSDY